MQCQSEVRGSASSKKWSIVYRVYPRTQYSTTTGTSSELYAYAVIFSGLWKAMATHINLHMDANGYVDYLHPLALAAKANLEDNPRWNEAMNGPHAEGYWHAMGKEFTTLTDQKDAWDVVN